LIQGIYKIALLGNFTTELIGYALEAECEKAGIKISVYNGPFRQYNQEIMRKDSGYYAFEPDLTIFLLDGHALFPQWYDARFLNKNSVQECENHVEVEANQIKELIRTIHDNCNTKIIINNFKVPYYSPLGILDTRSATGLKHMVYSLNRKLECFAAKTDYAYVFDYNGLCAHIGHCRSEDNKLSCLAGCPVSYHAIKQLANEYMRYILPLNAMGKKCLVLDLDNTLWGGIAAEDGIGGVSLDITGPGKSFYDFQKEIMNLYHRGILLAINSKNNPQDALEIIENHPHMLLRKSFFSCIRINWQDKVTNLREIASELNIGLDSLVFADDSPVEREYVKAMLPQVAVIDLPEDPAAYCEKLRSVPFFETLGLTAEDARRSEMIAQNRERSEARKLYGSIEEYLKSLDMNVTVLAADEFNIPRISQLSLKTNQFNMTTKRYQTADIKKMLESGKYTAYCCSVSDRFGDSGITGCCIAKTDGEDAYIDTFLMSCRVLGRNVEYAFLSSVIKLLREKGIRRITAKFIPTAKNTANSGFFEKAGFRVVDSNEESTLFELDEGMEMVEFDYIKVSVCSSKETSRS